MSGCAYGQTRNINIRTLIKDSVVASLSSDYYLIEDSCAQILRYSRFDFQRKKFMGKFRDVSRDDSSKIISEGNYNENGLKDGDFVVYYLNGKLHAKGSFKNDKYEGKWEFYNEDGSPQMTFDAVGGHISIIDVWNKNHKKIVNEGNGKYQVDSFLAGYVWTGRLVNGTPNGTWSLVNENNDDAQLTKEDFENGKFIKGGNAVQTYTDSSHIVLVDTTALAFVNAEKLQFSPASCDLAKLRSSFVNAKYAYGDKGLLNLLTVVVSNYMQRSFKDRDMPLYNHFVSIHGEINEKGDLVNLALSRQSTSEQGLVDGLESGFLRSQPANIGGRPVKQKIVFTFRFVNGACNFSYELLPVNLKQ
jgi:hypothetical protein